MMIQKMWSNIAFHVEQFSSTKQKYSCGAKLLLMKIFAPRRMYTASATNIKNVMGIGDVKTFLLLKTRSTDTIS